MWLQFKLNPQQLDKTQQQIFMLMPWVMMVILAPFAAGLVLYWVTSNVLTIAQQWWLYRRFGLTCPTLIRSRPKWRRKRTGPRKPGNCSRGRSSS
jgi:membrane protein insertase Oxa1/YidC/SpoIIIJ